jgi:hypothetical protein
MTPLLCLFISPISFWTLTKARSKVKPTRMIASCMRNHKLRPTPLLRLLLPVPLLRLRPMQVLSCGPACLAPRILPAHFDACACVSGSVCIFPSEQTDAAKAANVEDDAQTTVSAEEENESVLLVSDDQRKPRVLRSSLDRFDKMHPSQWFVRGGGSVVACFGGQIHSLTFSTVKLPTGRSFEADSVRFIDRMRFKARLVLKTVHVNRSAVRVARFFEVAIRAAYLVMSDGQDRIAHRKFKFPVLCGIDVFVG